MAAVQRPGVEDMAQQEPAADRIGRMEFLLRLRRQGIGDQGVLRAMDEVPREHFVPNEFIEEAYSDQALPIACGQTISQPFVVAYMTEQLRVRPSDRVLEIGTGSGYQAAILGRIAREVVTIERYRTLAEAARTRLSVLGIHNVEVRVGDGTLGVPERVVYDRILVTAAVDLVPSALIEQLAVDGILLLPLGPIEGIQMLTRIIRTPDGLREEALIPVRFVPLRPGQAQEL